MEVTIDMVDMSMLAVIPPFPVRYGLSQSRSGSQEAKYSALRLIESKSPSEGLILNARRPFPDWPGPRCHIRSKGL